MYTNYFIISNLLNPAILFFVLGIICGLLKSDLKIPKDINKFLFIYLLITIGFKGGASLNNIDNFNFTIFSIMIIGVAISFIMPFIGYKLLSATSKFDNYTIAAIAASYGSVSIITFMIATNILNIEHIKYDGYIIALLVLMEVPAIFSGLILAKKHNSSTINTLKQIFVSSSVLLLIGSLMIGWVTGKDGLESLKGFFLDPFQGILAIFLLNMGLTVSKNFNKNYLFNWPIISFAIYMPLIGAFLGLTISKIIGLDTGNGFLFAVLCASSSYIAVPAAMKLTLPEANSSIYVPMSLSITFPFNIIFGISLYYAIAKLIL